MKQEYKPEQKKFLKNMGNNIKTYRLKTGLSQDNFAYECGLERAYYGKVERGKSNISVFTLKRIANGLKIETYKLLMVK